MEVWSQGHLFADRPVQFLCVCVDDLVTAKNFERIFGFSKVINGWIPDRQYMPRGFGQLGCSGFVIVDGKGTFISKKSASFLQKGEAAFRAVEALVATHCTVANAEQPTVPTKTQTLHANYPYSVGSMALLDGLKKEAQLNGKPVRILAFSTETRRYSVELASEGSDGLESRHILAVRPCCLAPMRAAASAGSVNGSEGDNLKEITAIVTPPSVGVESMDNEHEKCTEAINALLIATREDSATPALLHRVLEVLQEHFDHEEVLMKENGFGDRVRSDSSSSSSDLSRFSAFSSHVKDHERILNTARGELKRLTDDLATNSRTFVSSTVAQELAHGFHMHSTRFDALYAGHILSSDVQRQ